MFMFNNGLCHDTNAQDADAIAVSGRPFQPYRDVVFYEPEGQFLNDSLVNCPNLL